MIKNLHITHEVGEKLEDLAEQLGLDKAEVGAMAIRHGVEVLLGRLGSEESGRERSSDPSSHSER